MEGQQEDRRMEGKVWESPDWHIAPDSPVVDHDAHYKDVFQKPNPRILNAKDFHRHVLASQWGLAACTHGERVLNVPQEGTAKPDFSHTAPELTEQR